MRQFVALFFALLVAIFPGLAFGQDSTRCVGQVVDANRIGKFYTFPLVGCEGVPGYLEIENNTDTCLAFEFPNPNKIIIFGNDGRPIAVPSPITIYADDGQPIVVKDQNGQAKPCIPPRRSPDDPFNIYGFMTTGDSRTKVPISAMGYGVPSNVNWRDAALIDMLGIGYRMHVMNIIGVSPSLNFANIEGVPKTLTCSEVAQPITHGEHGEKLSVDPQNGLERIRFTQGSFPCN